MGRTDRTEEFRLRFARHEEELRWLFMELYHGDEQAYSFFTGMLRRMYEERSEKLCELAPNIRLIKDDKVEFRWLRRKETNDVLLSMAPFMH